MENKNKNIIDNNNSNISKNENIKIINNSLRFEESNNVTTEIIAEEKNIFSGNIIREIE